MSLAVVDQCKASFKHLIKFKEAIPYLIQLLHIGEVWTVNCELAYAYLVKCHVEFLFDLEGSEKASFLVKNAKVFGDGTRKALDSVIKGNTDFSETINRLV